MGWAEVRRPPGEGGEQRGHRRQSSGPRDVLHPSTRHAPSPCTPSTAPGGVEARAHTNVPAAFLVTPPNRGQPDVLQAVSGWIPTSRGKEETTGTTDTTTRVNLQIIPRIIRNRPRGKTTTFRFRSYKKYRKCRSQAQMTGQRVAWDGEEGSQGPGDTSGGDGYTHSPGGPLSKSHRCLLTSKPTKLYVLNVQLTLCQTKLFKKPHTPKSPSIELLSSKAFRGKCFFWSQRIQPAVFMPTVHQVEDPQASSGQQQASGNAEVLSTELRF